MSISSKRVKMKRKRAVRVKASVEIYGNRLLVLKKLTIFRNKGYSTDTASFIFITFLKFFVK